MALNLTTDNIQDVKEVTQSTIKNEDEFIKYNPETDSFEKNTYVNLRETIKNNLQGSFLRHYQYLDSSADLDNVLTFGMFAVEGAANTPDTNGSGVLVINDKHKGQTGNYTLQTYTSAEGRVFTRQYLHASSSWTDWVEVGATIAEQITEEKLEFHKVGIEMYSRWEDGIGDNDLIGVKFGYSEFSNIDVRAVLFDGEGGQPDTDNAFGNVRDKQVKQYVPKGALGYDKYFYVVGGLYKNDDVVTEVKYWKRIDYGDSSGIGLYDAAKNVVYKTAYEDEKFFDGTFFGILTPISE